MNDVLLKIIAELL